MAHAGLLVACPDVNGGTVGLEGQVFQQTKSLVFIGLSDGQVHEEVVEVVSGDEVLLVEADAVAKLCVKLLQCCYVEEGVVVVRYYRFEGVSLVLPVVTERNHQGVLQVPLRLEILEEGSDSIVDESHGPSEVLMPLDQIDLRQLGTVFVFIEEVGGILKGVLGLGVVVEAAVSCS